jgi:hypothetical protein
MHKLASKTGLKPPYGIEGVMCDEALASHIANNMCLDMGISLVGVSKKFVSTSKSAHVSVSNESIF